VITDSCCVVLLCFTTVKHNGRTPASEPTSRGSAVQKIRRKRSENMPTSEGGTTSATNVFSLVGNYALLIFSMH
jgi:hypothetical protein